MNEVSKKAVESLVSYGGSQEQAESLVDLLDRIHELASHAMQVAQKHVEMPGITIIALGAIALKEATKCPIGAGVKVAAFLHALEYAGHDVEAEKECIEMLRMASPASSLWELDSGK